MHIMGLMEEKTRLLTVQQFAKSTGIEVEDVAANLAKDDFYTLFYVNLGDAIYIEATEVEGWRAKRLKASKTMPKCGPVPRETMPSS